MLPLLVLLFLSSCKEGSEVPRQKGEYISRTQDQRTWIPPMTKQERVPAFWEKSTQSVQEITKEYFRCKGNGLNPIKSEIVRGEVVRYSDCGGQHSLPLREGKESVYPILIELMNYIQKKHQKRLVITSGHRCPEHNAYVDPSPDNQYSKHQIGAEVAFYVQGLESRPEAILETIFSYYQERYNHDKDYIFKRYEKETNVSSPPWMNKEIFIKLNKAHEGRNGDNRHPYPYITIQVRYDRDKNERVAYSWDQAFGKYHRY